MSTNNINSPEISFDPSKCQDSCNRILRVQLVPRENSEQKIKLLFFRYPALNDLPFELMAEIFKCFHYIDVSPLKGVCREWFNIINEMFVFYPTGPNPFQLSFQKYYLNMNFDESDIKHFDWKMILNFLGNVVPKDCGVITLVVRVIEYKQCSSDIEKQQIGFQTKVHEIANSKHIEVKGYIQTQSIERDETKRVFDICAQGVPEKLKYFLEQVANISNSDGQFVVLPLDVNFIYKSKIDNSFIFKTTQLKDPNTQHTHIVSMSDEADLTSITTEESVFTLNSLTKTRANLRNIVLNSIADKTTMVFLLESDCPPFILKVLTLYSHQEFKQSILDIIVSMRKTTGYTVFSLNVELLDPIQCIKPFWKELKKRCTQFLETNSKAKHVLACSCTKLFSSVHLILNR